MLHLPTLRSLLAHAPLHPLLALASAALLLPAAALALTATPSTTEGPYYPFNSGQTLSTAWLTGEAADNDLTHIYSTSAQCKGTIMLLSGTLVDSNGTAISGATIELWEADSGGIYYYVASTNNYSSRDTTFQPYGTATTDSSGAWSFRCIKPGLYTGRIRHFHYKVNVNGSTKLTSQFMFTEDSASFSSDNVAAPLVSAGTMSLTTLTPTSGTDSSGNSVLIATKQIVLSGTYSTTTVVAPTITTQPASVTITAGNNATFSVVASSTATLSYQWYKSTTALSGATSSSYTISSAATSAAGSYYVIVTNSAGSVTSSTATLTVNAATTAPTITTQPASVTITAGNNATFSVVATGTATLSYQWYKSTTALSGATSSSYTISSAATSAAGSYYVVVTNSAGSVTSSTATLTVNAATTAPSITTQPASVTITAGNNATFSVVATGTATLSYQWYQSTTALTGATSSSYTISSATTSAAGSYYVIVTNSAGSATSSTATLTVNAATTTTTPTTGTGTTTTATAPAIVTSPSSSTITAGDSITFSVVASGTATLSYQWYKSTTALSGATSSSYTISSAATSAAGSYYVIVTNSAGSVTSGSATLTVNAAIVAPTIATSPTSATVTAGDTVTFAVAATGTAPLSYQWLKDNVALSAATSATYTLASAATSAAGAYTVVVTNSAGSATSAAATLTVNLLAPTDTAPAILTPPSSTTVAARTGVTFTVAATGTGPLAYQWYKSSTALPGATASTYSIASTVTTDAGTYTVTVTNSAGSVTSAAATLTVTSAALVNLSVRSYLPSSSAVLTAGFVIQSSAGKRLLVRAVGPALTTFGVADALADPTLEIFDVTSAKTAENDNWSSTLGTTFAQLGAFGLPAGSKDSALVVNLPAGAGTAQVRGSTAGVALVEAYDMASTSASRLVNVSARAIVGTDPNTLITGFVIQGTGTLRLLVRAVGPKLAEFGVTGALADPKIALYDSTGAKVAENDNWDSALAPLIAQAGGFALTPGSKDAAILVTLPAGTGYTAVVSSATTATGEALIELYEIP